ncbi:MFS transporter [Streptomyces pilosus]|uniref:MFS transporter n=1 Tax=Streptomyces pilosus TaxID=28893 RepID=A0A918C4I5_9ACTN|nr:MFS transporter [Streptomyces pilosus]GGR06376.1 MFS transporter [Streptomyces pilosus]GGV69044.1 MFS transporter [Streptomyces pilosus]
MPLFVNEPVERLSRPYARRWWALLVLCLSLMISVMANTALTVAAPAMTRDLDLSSSDLQWVIDAYTVPYAALMLLLGAIGDKYGRRGSLVLGLLIMAAGGVAGAFADTSVQVIVVRAVMGFGAAMIMPATLSLLAATFPREERAKAITIWAATSGLSIAAGPLIAGVLLKGNGWESTFLINVPVCVIAVLAAYVLVPPSKAGDRGRIDYGGGVLSVIWSGALIYMIIDGPHFGWGASAFTAAGIAGLGLLLFVGWELRHPRPILDVRKFAQRAFAGANLAIAVFFLAVFGVFYYLTQHFQFVLDHDPLETGIRMLPLALGVFLGAAATGALTPRLGPGVMVTVGMVGGTTALALLVGVDASSTYADFVAPLALLGVSLGLAVSPCTDTIMGAFPESELGVGGAVNDTSLELGGSLGIAVLGSALASSYAANLTDATEGRDVPPEALEAATDSVAAGNAVAQSFDEKARQLAEQAAQASPEDAAALERQAAEVARGSVQMADAVGSAFSDAVSRTSLIGAVVLGAATLVVAVLMRGKPARPRPPEQQGPHPEPQRPPVATGAGR